ncbi:MAG: [acyl-carrier-protein] S-malonyltransferase [Elusimicrobia bacterium RIFOXYA2_FULL_39_19]|nr:MAG: [acyl-carrier-protein] S-malonyltransferase [Elusimicrobia bacterium RIFOXYA2_FULL_39_19]
MSKIALVFPGQGAQYVGMGKELYESYPEAKSILNSSNDILGYDIKSILFNGPEEKLRETIITQPAIFLVSIVAYEILAKQCPEIITNSIFTAGHSLGEYSALYAAGVFDLNIGLNLVKKRAEFIYQASQENPGTMAAIVGMEEAKLKEMCTEISKPQNPVEMANFNTSSQIVVSGKKEAVTALVEAINTLALPAVKTIMLNVSGAFHSSLMNEASLAMKSQLDNTTLNNPKIPVITNFDSEPTISESEIKNKLVKQIDHPVLWQKTMEKLTNSGVDTYIEMGPGKILSAMIKKANRAAKTYNIENKATLEKVIMDLKNQ